MLAELGTTVGEALLAPHRSYLSTVKPLLDRQYVRGLAHVTGGGITENLPRILPGGCAAEIDLHAWTVPPLFRLLQQQGQIPADEMFRVFNMGIGLIVACAAGDAERAIETLSRAGEPGAVRIGFVVSGDRRVTYL